MSGQIERQSTPSYAHQLLAGLGLCVLFILLTIAVLA